MNVNQKPEEVLGHVISEMPFQIARTLKILEIIYAIFGIMLLVGALMLTPSGDDVRRWTLKH